ncbi:MAG: hypothetical protein Q4F27_00340 [Desulfovibrionaceae bacterium]|nr:hypothetical protein [Desulfovibrionaceae bacterium]
MSSRLLLARRAFFVRDLVRDYCTVFQLILEQQRRFMQDGTVSYSALRDLLGGAMQKGVFWRLKDTAHHLFRNAPGTGSPREENIVLWQYAASPLPDGMSVQSPVEALIDWCVGYAFHECAKLKEDAFQRQHYAGRLAQLGRHSAVGKDLYAPLAALGRQTTESLSRELERILHVLRHGLFLLVQYLASEGRNTHLARWLACEEQLARTVFGPLYAPLLTALFGEEPQRLYRLAAQDFLSVGRYEEARDLLHRASQLGRLDSRGLTMLDRLQHRIENRAASTPGMGCIGQTGVVQQACHRQCPPHSPEGTENSGKATAEQGAGA